MAKAIRSGCWTSLQAKVDVNIALTPTQRQFTKFAAVGFVSNFILYCLYLLLTGFSLQPHVAMTIIYAAGVTFTYLMNRNWTFVYSGPRRAALLRYLLVYGLGYGINFLGLSVMVDRLSYPHKVVQAGLILVLAIALFLAQKFWVFDKSGSQLHLSSEQ